MPVPLYQAKAEFFRMLGHPVRIRVLELLQDGPKPVRDLLAETGIEPSSLSQQLAVLRRSGIVTATATRERPECGHQDQRGGGVHLALVVSSSSSRRMGLFRLTVVLADPRWLPLVDCTPVIPQRLAPRNLLVLKKAPCVGIRLLPPLPYESFYPQLPRSQPALVLNAQYTSIPFQVFVHTHF